LAVAERKLVADAVGELRRRDMGVRRDPAEMLRLLLSALDA
jgi:hypothetical protein